MADFEKLYELKQFLVSKDLYTTDIEDIEEEFEYAYEELESLQAEVGDYCAKLDIDYPEEANAIENPDIYYVGLLHETVAAAENQQEYVDLLYEKQLSGLHASMSLQGVNSLDNQDRWFLGSRPIYSVRDVEWLHLMHQ